jgi:hypothetical protein
LDWGQLHWTLVKTHLLHPQDTYILAGDEVVVTKAGDETHGLNRFFSSLFGKTVPGVAFFAFALVNVPPRTAHPLRMGQVLRPEPPATEVAPAPAPPAEKRGPGRPKGSKNRNKADVELSPHLCFIQTLLRAVLTAIGTTLVLSYVVLDGAFGNNYALQMVRRCQLHLISKLAVNSALYFLYDGPYSGHGPYTKYGARVKYGQLPAKYLKRTSTEKGIRTDIYQFQALHKLFAQTLNIVIIVKTNTQTGAWAHAILFSSELAQSYEQIVEYYTLRFQIEFVFRDAKQYWGLEDFMNIKETPVTNAANLAFFMVNLAQILRRQLRPKQPDFSVLDLKAHFRGLKYVAEVLKLLPQTPDPIVIQQIAAKVALIGAVNAT